MKRIAKKQRKKRSVKKTQPFYRDWKILAIVSFVILAIFLVPFLFYLSSFTLNGTGYPAQQNQWGTATGEHYVWIMDYHDSYNDTNNEIIKTYINETNNGDTSYPIDDNLTNVFVTNYIWTNISMTEWTWQWDWYNRLPYNSSVSVDMEFFLIPLFYKNYMMSLYMINDSITSIVDSHGNEDILNTTMSYEETIVSINLETSENMFYYNGEYIVDDIYKAVKYDFEFWSYDSSLLEYYHGKTQHIVELNTGIPLMQSLVFEFIDSSGTDTLVFNAKTILTSISLQEV